MCYPNLIIVPFQSSTKFQECLSPVKKHIVGVQPPYPHRLNPYVIRNSIGIRRRGEEGVDFHRLDHENKIYFHFVYHEHHSLSL